MLSPAGEGCAPRGRGGRQVEVADRHGLSRTPPPLRVPVPRAHPSLSIQHRQLVGSATLSLPRERLRCSFTLTREIQIYSSLPCAGPTLFSSFPRLALLLSYSFCLFLSAAAAAVTSRAGKVAHEKFCSLVELFFRIR